MAEDPGRIRNHCALPSHHIIHGCTRGILVVSLSTYLVLFTPPHDPQAPVRLLKPQRRRPPGSAATSSNSSLRPCTGCCGGFDICVDIYLGLFWAHVIISRCCFHNELCSVAGTVHGDDIFVAGLKKRWETRDQMIGPKPGDQKERHILNRTLRWCEDGLVLRRI